LVPKEEEDYNEMKLLTNCNQPLLLWNIHIDTTIALYKIQKKEVCNSNRENQIETLDSM